MPELTGAWMRFAKDAIPRYSVHLAPAMYHIHPSEIINRAAAMAACEAMRIASLPGYTGELLEVAKDLKVLKEDSDAKDAAAKAEAEREAVQLGDVDEGQILRFPSLDGTPVVDEVGANPAS